MALTHYLYECGMWEFTRLDFFYAPKKVRGRFVANRIITTRAFWEDPSSYQRQFSGYNMLWEGFVDMKGDVWLWNGFQVWEKD